MRSPFAKLATSMVWLLGRRRNIAAHCAFRRRKRLFKHIQTGAGAHRFLAQDTPEQPPARTAMIEAQDVARDIIQPPAVRQMTADVRHDPLQGLPARRHGIRHEILAAGGGDVDGATEAFALGLAAVRSARHVWMTASLLTCYGRALASFGLSEDAEPLLDEAQELWEQMGATRQLERVAAARGHVEVSA